MEFDSGHDVGVDGADEFRASAGRACCHYDRREEAMRKMFLRAALNVIKLCMDTKSVIARFEASVRCSR